jgi:TRAP-type mannitol/chloroaromatic compound transport system permease small subunit
VNVVRRILKSIDSLSTLSGNIGKWFALALVLVGSFETVARHFFNSPTIWAYDVLCMSGGALYLLGASYDLLHESHTRVDVIYQALKPRVRASLDIFFSLLLFFPLMGVMFWYAVKWSARAIRIEEKLFNSFWYPPAAPYRIVFAVGLGLLLLQGLAKLTRDIHIAVKGQTID